MQHTLFAPLFALGLVGLCAPLAAQTLPAPAMQSVTLLTTAVKRGDILSADMLAPGTLPLSQARGTLSADALVGLEVRRALSEGAALRAGDVKEPDLVKRGARVVISLNSDSLSITVIGKALEDGPLGKVIRVENTSSKRILEAQITGHNAVSIAAL